MCKHRLSFFCLERSLCNVHVRDNRGPFPMLLPDEGAFQVNEIQRIESLQFNYPSMVFDCLQPFVRAEAAVNTAELR